MALRISGDMLNIDYLNLKALRKRFLASSKGMQIEM